MKFSQVWDLDSIFIGGSRAGSFKKAYFDCEEKLKELAESLNESALFKSIALLQKLGLNLKQMQSFVDCLNAQNVEDSEVSALLVKMRNLSTVFSNLHLVFDEILNSLSDSAFTQLLCLHSPIAFLLKEKRFWTKEKLSLQEENLVNHLASSGYHGWSELWDTIIGGMLFNFQDEMLSFGQIENKFGLADRNQRKEAFHAVEKEFQKKARLFALTLNHLAGFRLELYKTRGWHDVLKEPLFLSRLKRSSLEAMWEVVENNQQPFLDYLKCKANLLGVDSLHWYDLEAPLCFSSEEITYDQAAYFIIKQFETFSPKLAEFTKRVFQEKWIEAENRKGKRQGGFCCAFPVSKESRIFMTFSNTMMNLFILAHEIGHAFHNDILFSNEEMAQHPTLGLAETASTMAEMIVTRAAIKNETDPKKRLFLLDNHLSRSVSYLMNIYARFLFENAFYEQRKEGFIAADTLSKLMMNAQKKAFGNILSTYHPFLWATKCHFYFTDTPFYNFPYTFGYLFSLGIYNKAKKQNDFEATYLALLKDSGNMTSEELARNHLGVDLTEQTFWQQGIDTIKEHINEFIQLAQEVL